MGDEKFDLMPGETLVLSAHPHWWYFWKQVAAGVGVLLFVFLMWVVDIEWLATVFGWLALISAVVWLANTVYEFVQWRTTRFAVTDERVAYTSGIIRRVGVSIPLNRVNNVNFEQSLIARILNNGVVTIESAGETGDSVFENIPDPKQTRATIFAQMQADEQADSNRDAAAIADALRGSGGTGSVQDRLNELDRLLEQGHVSQEEYEAKRQQIIADL